MLLTSVKNKMLVFLKKLNWCFLKLLRMSKIVALCLFLSFSFQSVHVDAVCGENYFMDLNKTLVDLHLFPITNLKKNFTVNMEMVIKELGYKKQTKRTGFSNYKAYDFCNQLSMLTKIILHLLLNRIEGKFFTLNHQEYIIS